MNKLLIADMNLTCRFCVRDLNTGHYIFSRLDQDAPGDIPPDIACLPVFGICPVHTESGPVLYIDTFA